MCVNFVAHQWFRAVSCMLKKLMRSAMSKCHYKPYKASPRVLIILALAVCLFASQAMAQATWTKVSTTGPSSRSNHSMAYDSRRGVVVLFGGGDETVAGETWEWDGTKWTQINIEGPIIRRYHKMVYDSRRGVVVLFGGLDSRIIGTDLHDTWEYDGTKWTEIDVSGPENDYGFGMAYDRDRGVTVLYGGNDLSKKGTWEYDGAGWKKASDTSVHPAGGASGFRMAYDSVRKRTFLFGGWQVGDYLGTTHEWDGSSWTQVATDDEGPPNRSTHSTAFDSNWGKVVIFGGQGPDESGSFETTKSDTWAWDGTWTKIDIPGPSKRYNFDMAFDSRRGKIVLFGGTGDYTAGSETWEFDSGYRPPGPDLAVTSIKVDAKKGMAGEKRTVTVKVANDGVEDARNFYVQLSEGNDPVDSIFVDKLNQGGSTELEFDYIPLKKGKKKLVAYADPFADIADMDRSNNSAQAFFKSKKLKGIDLVMTHVSVKLAGGSAPPKAAELVVSFRISNCGTKACGPFKYKVYLTRREKKISGKDTLVADEEILALKAGGQLVITKTVNVKKITKKFYFQGMLDPENAIKEANEGNNTVVRLFLKKGL